MSKNDTEIKKVLEKIAKKRKEMGDRPQYVLKTNGVFKFDNGADYLNIHVVQKVEDCVNAVAFLLNQKALREEAAKLLEVSFEDYRYDNFTFEDWVHDFKFRAATISWDIEKKKLTKLEKRLKDLRSEDAKTADAITDILGELG
jgi:hypothetical protein